MQKEQIQKPGGKSAKSPPNPPAAQAQLGEPPAGASAVDLKNFFENSLNALNTGLGLAPVLSPKSSARSGGASGKNRKSGKNPGSSADGAGGAGAGSGAFNNKRQQPQPTPSPGQYRSDADAELLQTEKDYKTIKPPAQQPQAPHINDKPKKGKNAKKNAKE